MASNGTRLYRGWFTDPEDYRYNHRARIVTAWLNDYGLSPTWECSTSHEDRRKAIGGYKGHDDRCRITWPVGVDPDFLNDLYTAADRLQTLAGQRRRIEAYALRHG